MAQGLITRIADDTFKKIYEIKHSYFIKFITIHNIESFFTSLGRNALSVVLIK